ncbi:MAG: hypothetical protein Q9M91_04490 [Candidatus Dojkabacteria bacterium]|nr:hypothetical protein [Candidatus Dojkabacteria bacterium]
MNIIRSSTLSEVPCVVHISTAASTSVKSILYKDPKRIPPNSSARFLANQTIKTCMELGKVKTSIFNENHRAYVYDLTRGLLFSAPAHANIFSNPYLDFDGSTEVMPIRTYITQSGERIISIFPGTFENMSIEDVEDTLQNFTRILLQQKLKNKNI